MKTLEEIQNMLGRPMKEGEYQMFDIFGTDEYYEPYVNEDKNLAFRKLKNGQR